MPYKLYVNGRLAVFNGLKKGTLTYQGVPYFWDNTDYSGGGGSEETEYYPNLYDSSNATQASAGQNIYCEYVTLVPNTDYVFEIIDYTWAGVTIGGTTIGNNASANRKIEFNSGSNTTARLQFYPGSGVSINNIDWNKILFYKAGQYPGDVVVPETPAEIVSYNIDSLLKTATSASPIEVVFMGDSITEGYTATGMMSAGTNHPVPTWENYDSWAGLLSRHIKSKYPNVTVTNRGYSGMTSSYGYDNRNNWITNSRQIAIVMYGTNNRTSQAAMDRLESDYTAIRQRCESVGARMVPMCCIPSTTFNEQIAGKYVTTMATVHQKLMNWGTYSNYQVVDLYSKMMEYVNNDITNALANYIDCGTNTTDAKLHIHPNDAGHRLMYDWIRYEILGEEPEKEPDPTDDEWCIPQDELTIGQVFNAGDVISNHYNFTVNSVSASTLLNNYSTSMSPNWANSAGFTRRAALVPNVANTSNATGISVTAKRNGTLYYFCGLTSDNNFATTTTSIKGGFGMWDSAQNKNISGSGTSGTRASAEVCMMNMDIVAGRTYTFYALSAGSNAKMVIYGLRFVAK